VRWRCTQSLDNLSYKGETYEGRHEAIVDRATFDAVQALLHHRSSVWKRRAPNLERAPLQGRLFDTLGQRMKPVFARRKGKLYGYYAAPKLMLGLMGPAGPDALTRVPSRLLDDFIRRRLIDLTGVAPEDISTAVLREVVARVEVHGDAVQMVISLRALKSLNADLGDARTVEARLHLGDRLLAEASRPNHVRISIPIRMKMRGGRTWLEDAEMKAGKAATAARLAAIKRLREAHNAFEPARPALARQLPRVRSAHAPFSDLGRIDWVFLAPGIQSAILNGRLDLGAIARLEDQPSIPLSWAVQRRLLQPNCAVETSSC
jgi:site-specific DNA recombinase